MGDILYHVIEGQSPSGMPRGAKMSLTVFEPK